MLLKIVGYLFALVLLLVCAVLLVVRYQPQWLVAAANGVQSDVQVKAESVGVTYAPLALQVGALDLRLPGQQVALAGLSTQANFSAWWTDEPFWLVEVDRANVHLDASEPSPPTAPEPADPQATPLNFLSYLSFTKVRVGELLVQQQGVDAPLLRLQLDAGLEAQQAQDIQLKATGEAAGTTFELAGNLTRKAQSLGFDLQGGASQQGNMQAKLKLAGELAGGREPSLLLTDAMLDLLLDAQRHLLQNLAGEISLVQVAGTDGVKLTALTGSYQAPGWDAPQPVAADLTAASPDGAWQLDGKLELGESKLTLETLSTKVAQSWHGQLNLASAGLPPAISVQPYAVADLFPLQLQAELALSAAGLTATGLKLDSPTNQLGGDLALVFDGPLEATAKLKAARLYLPLVSGESKSTAGTTESPAVASVSKTESESKPVASPTAKSTVGSEVKPERVEQKQAAGSEDLVFAKEPMDWSWLQQLLLQLELDAQELKLQDAVFTDFAVQLVSKEGQLALAPFSAKIGNGGFDGSLELGLAEAAADQVAAKLSLQVKDVELESFGFVPQEELRGGALEVDIQLTSGGQSAHDLAAGLNGDLMIIVDEAVLMNDFIELAGSDLLMETLNKLNPFRKEDPTTELKCGLVHFAAEQGVLRSRKQLVMETSKMEIIGDGKVDLGKEQLSITFSPIAKSGIGLNVGSLVKFLKLGGRLNNPKPTAGAGGLLKSGAAIGAAISTGGLSVVADGMASRALNAGSACAAIRKSRAGAAAASPASS